MCAKFKLFSLASRLPTFAMWCRRPIRQTAWFSVAGSDAIGAVEATFSRVAWCALIQTYLNQTPSDREYRKDTKKHVFSGFVPTAGALAHPDSRSVKRMDRRVRSSQGKNSVLKGAGGMSPESATKSLLCCLATGPGGSCWRCGRN